MAGELTSAEHYRAMAHEIRAVAKNLKIEEAKVTLLMLADRYERMAELYDRPLGKSHPS
jgi:thymidylate kinase